MQKNDKEALKDYKEQINNRRVKDPETSIKKMTRGYRIDVCAEILANIDPEIREKFKTLLTLKYKSYFLEKQPQTPLVKWNYKNIAFLWEQELTKETQRKITLRQSEKEKENNEKNVPK